MSGVALGALGVNGCYSIAPMGTAPAPAQTVVVELTDRGRLDYGTRIGTGVRHVQGTVEAVTDSTLVLRVASVETLDGRVDQWSGERVALTRDAFTNVRERRFSTARTVLVSVALVGAVTAAFLSAKLLGGASETDTGRPGPPPNQ